MRFEKKKKVDDGEETLFPVAAAIKRVLKAVVIAVIVLLFVFVFFRSCMKRDTNFVKSYAMTIAAQYAAQTETLDVKRLPSYPDTDIDNIFSVSGIMYTAQTRGFQLTIRGNDSRLKREYADIAAREGEKFTYALVDDKGKTYTEYEFAGEKKYMYTYRKLVFEGVSLDGVENLKLYVFDGDGSVNLGDAFAVLKVYDASGVEKETRLDVSGIGLTEMTRAKSNVPPVKYADSEE